MDKGITFNVTDPLKYKDENSDLFLVVVNSQSTHMDENRKSSLSNIQLDVTLKEALPYHHLKIFLDSITVIQNYNNGQISTWKNQDYHFGDVIVYDEYKGNFSKDNVFTGGWDFINTNASNNSTFYWGDVIATIDPDSLKLLDFDIKTNHNFLGSGKDENEYIYEDKRRITGINVQLEKSYNGLYGRIKGKNLIQHINLFERNVKFGDPSRDLIEGSYIDDIEFTEDSVLKIFFSDQD
jgi:hypothetical protein